MKLSELSGRAVQEAERLAHSELDPEHLVLSMLHPEVESTAGRALQACGLTFELFLREIEHLPPKYLDRKGTPVPPRGRIVSREGTSLLARAEGLALGLGSAHVRTEDVLVAIIWGHPGSMVTQILDRLGATRERIREELELLDVDMPSVPFPRRREWEEWRPISREELDRLGAELRSADTLYRVAYGDDQPLVSVEKARGTT
jgi:ATP-dependent Clp protease ATP-binding subunit ClpA